MFTIIMTLMTTLYGADLTYIQQCQELGGVVYNADTDECTTSIKYNNGDCTTYNKITVYQGEELKGMIPDC